MGLFPDAAGAPAAPLSLQGSLIYTGTCSWADPSFVAEFYPEAVRAKPRARLRYYSELFPTVEVDATYHALQPVERAVQWAETVPSPFLFNIKAFAWLTWHGSAPTRLPREIFVLLSRTMQTEKAISPVRLPEEILTATWDYFAAFIDAMRVRERLGYVLFQFPKGQGFTQELFKYLDAWALYLENWPVAIEIRHKDWLEGKARGTLMGYLREHGFAYVIPDLAPARYLPPSTVETTTDFSVVRFHGRNPALAEKGVSTNQAYDYEYSTEELKPWAETSERLAGDVRRLFLMFNNHFRGKSGRNAREIQGMLAERLGHAAPPQAALPQESTRADADFSVSE
ncbi:MAG: DUF72 domain-containing protein [bacterium]